MVADFLHSFYTMPLNIVIGGVPTVVHVRWYRAPAGAKYLPFPSAIFSHVWDNNPGESQPGEIGEVGFPRTWDRGDNPGYQGRCYRGDPSWFATGQLPPLAGLAPGPCNCQIPPAVGSGGLVLGGSARPSDSVCQQNGALNAPPLVDILDGNGPQPWAVHTSVGGWVVWTARTPDHVAQLGVGRTGTPTTCCTVGTIITQVTFPFIRYTVTGAIKYLLSSRHARWDALNDGTTIIDVQT